MNLPFLPAIVTFAKKNTLVLVAVVLVIIVTVMGVSGWRYFQYRQSSQYAYETLRDALKTADTENIAELVDFNTFSTILAQSMAQSYPFLKAGPDQERQLRDMVQISLLKQIRTKQEPLKDEIDLKTRLRTPLYALPQDFIAQIVNTMSLQTSSEGTALLSAKVRHPLLDKNFQLIFRMDMTPEGWRVRSLVNGPELVRQFREAQVERMNAQRQTILDKNTQTERRMKEIFPLQSCSASAGLISDGHTLLLVTRVLARNIGTVSVNNMNVSAQLSTASGSVLLDRYLNAVQPTLPGEDFDHRW
ncbi:MAG: translation initiation factor IF-2, partial [Desulfovibrio sp.]|nr:translation initiation factor IF-2 [Desulfovibrio sp.]